MWTGFFCVVFYQNENGVSLFEFLQNYAHGRRHIWMQKPCSYKGREYRSSRRSDGDDVNVREVVRSSESPNEWRYHVLCWSSQFSDHSSIPSSWDWLLLRLCSGCCAVRLELCEGSAMHFVQLERRLQCLRNVLFRNRNQSYSDQRMQLLRGKCHRRLPSEAASRGNVQSKPKTTLKSESVSRNTVCFNYLR